MRFVITCPFCFMDDLRQFGNIFECKNCGESFDISEADFSEDDKCNDE